MDKLSRKEEEIIKKWMGEVGVETPSPGFTDRIMQSIEKEKTVLKPYVPLISKKGWLIVALLFVLSMVLLYFFPIGGAGYLNEISVERPKFENLFSSIELSKTAMYAIGMLALFLVQLPFLKSLINKQYS
ncbi:MAG: hypothetical protein Aureis2KO_20510 [Aureisphaera sp.]